MVAAKRVTVMDDKYRVALGHELAKVSGIEKGTKLVAIPFRGGIILEVPGQRRFTESLPGFAYDESRHEADSYLKRLVKVASS